MLVVHFYWLQEKEDAFWLDHIQDYFSCPKENWIWDSELQFYFSLRHSWLLNLDFDEAYQFVTTQAKSVSIIGFHITVPRILTDRRGWLLQ